MKNILLLAFICLAVLSSAEAASVIFIGDSHSAGYFGKTLDQLLRSGGHSVATYAKGGSDLSSWIEGSTTPWGMFKRSTDGTITYVDGGGRTPRLSYLIEHHKPRSIVVALGTNNVGQSDQAFRSDLQKMLKIIQTSGAKCFWVTPPASRSILLQIPRLKKAILDVVGSYCATFQSDYVTVYPAIGGDGLHFSNYPGAKGSADYWAARVFIKFKYEL